uniref:Uncharacterized protein n=1 Tax=Dactylorhiza hatagirea beny-like virus TaxID=2765867 RepID=A0A8D9PH66_9VIRU|nr:TPA_exp: hypothetical protein [Dactylorhiza hatagirea beny-like virus]
MANVNANDVVEILKYTTICVDNCMHRRLEYQNDCAFKCLHVLNTTVGFAVRQTCATELVPSNPQLGNILYIIFSGFLMLFRWFYRGATNFEALYNFINKIIMKVIPSYAPTIVKVYQIVAQAAGVMAFIILVIKLIL